MLAVDALEAVGGKSSGPLRPQPASASALRLKTMMAHAEPAGRNFDVTTKSPLRGRTIQRLARAGESRRTMKHKRNFALSPIFALFPAASPRPWPEPPHSSA